MSTNFNYIPAKFDGMSDQLFFYDQYSNKRKVVTFFQEEGWVKTVNRESTPPDVDYCVGVVRGDHKAFIIVRGSQKVTWVFKAVEPEDII